MLPSFRQRGGLIRLALDTGEDSYGFVVARTELAACDFKASGIQCVTDKRMLGLLALSKRLGPQVKINKI